jgi:hypothetical protein
MGVTGCQESGPATPVLSGRGRMFLGYVRDCRRRVRVSDRTAVARAMPGAHGLGDQLTLTN